MVCKFAKSCTSKSLTEDEFNDGCLSALGYEKCEAYERNNSRYPAFWFKDLVKSREENNE